MSRTNPIIINLSDSDPDDSNQNSRYGTNTYQHVGGNNVNGYSNNDDSDSSCEVVSSRPAPKIVARPGPTTITTAGPAGPVVSFSDRARLMQTLSHPPASTSTSKVSPQPRLDPSREQKRTEDERNSARPSTRVKSDLKSPSSKRLTRPLGAGAPQLGTSITKLQIIPKDYPHRHVDVRGSRRCTNCIQDSRCCDGEVPCAFCFDPGFTCLYPGEDPVFPLRSPTTEPTEAVDDIQMASPDQWTVKYDREQFLNTADTQRDAVSSSRKEYPRPSSNASEDVLNSINSATATSGQFTSNPSRSNLQEAGHAGTHDNTLGRKKMASEDMQMELEQPSNQKSDLTDDSSVTSNCAHDVDVLELESIPATSWLPRSFEDVRNLMRIHEANIASHREYVVEAQLANAKLTSKRNVHIESERRGVNPFKKMVAALSRSSSSTAGASILNMRVKARRSDYTNLKVPVNLLGEEEAAHIPEYKSIGRLRSTFHARNVHGLKFVPYNPGIEEKDHDQRRKDLQTHFKEHGSEEFRKQRECLESVYQWSHDFTEILQELHISPGTLWKWLLQSNVTECQRCEISFDSLPTTAVSDAEPTKLEKQRCQWLYEAMVNTTQIGIWHFLLPKPGQIEKKSHVTSDVDSRSRQKEQLLCSLCFTHNCSLHGSFLDADLTTGGAVINDPEEQNNERQRTVLKDVQQNKSLYEYYLFHLPNFWKSSIELDCSQIIGLGDDGQLTGIRNKRVSLITDLGPFRGSEQCTPTCFLRKTNRRVTTLSAASRMFSEIDRTKQGLLISMAKLYSSHLRLPCMIQKLTGIECMSAFEMLLFVVNAFPVPAQEDENLKGRKNPAKAVEYNTKNSHVLEMRETWVPCSHEGPCLSTHSDCACALEQVHCEAACGCSADCKRRFKGCQCKKTCFMDDRCECYAANRECNPMICHNCGVEEVLDPSNKYRDDVRKGRCRNNRLQLDLPPRTVKGMSEVQGWGLFSGEDLVANSFIGEYKGENISESESDRRGAIYAYVSQEYLFNLNVDAQLDGSRFGNKTRFINNSKAKEFINVSPKVSLVNGVTRIGLYTNRAIKAGEELLYDYGYPKELIGDDFWEKHERAIEHNGIVTPIARPKFRPRMAKNAVDKPGHEDEEEEVEDGGEEEDGSEPIPKHRVAHSPSKGKGKRKIVEIFPSSDEEDNMATPQVSARDATDNSDYEAGEEEEGEASTEEDVASHESAVEEVDESEDELSKPTQREVPPRKDGRYGGEAQRRAAATKKRNKQMGK